MASQVKSQLQAHPSSEVELPPWPASHHNAPAAEAASSAVPIEEMDRNTSNRVSDIDVEDRVIQQLLPADGGPAAWRVLISAFVFEALLWGMYSFSLSLFLNLSLHNQTPQGKPS
jgi:hypothetical protein